VNVSGTGTVTNVTLNKGADGSNISTPNTSIKVDKEVSGATTAGKTPLQAGSNVTTDTDGKAAATDTSKADSSGNSHHSTSKVNKNTLTQAIGTANTNKESVAVSEDGSDVLTVNQWVTQEEIDAYAAAIAAAQAVADNGSATQAQVDAAVTALAAATTAFDSTKAAGSLTVPGDDRATLKNLILVAKTSLAAVTVSADGSDVDPADKWVTQEEYDAFNSAIQSAEGVAHNDDSTPTELSDALSSLTTAAATFESAIEDGTKTVGQSLKLVMGYYSFDLWGELAS
jgi:hypothetical protein